VEIPFDVREVYGTGGQVPVRATFDGETYRGSIAPMGGGRHVLGVTREIREAIGKDVGDSVHVVIERDTKPRTVPEPPDLTAALARSAGARDAFNGLSYTRRREYVRWIEEAKRPETRARRLQEVVERLTSVRKGG
jgi:hypothetical protein